MALHLSPKGSHPPPALSQLPPTERIAPHTWVPSEEGGPTAPTSGPASPRSSCQSWSCSSEDEREVTQEGVAATAVARALLRTRLLQRERETLQHRLQVQLIPPPRM